MHRTPVQLTQESKSAVQVEASKSRDAKAVAEAELASQTEAFQQEVQVLQKALATSESQQQQHLSERDTLKLELQKASQMHLGYRATHHGLFFGQTDIIIHYNVLLRCAAVRFFGPLKQYLDVNAFTLQ